MPPDGVLGVGWAPFTLLLLRAPGGLAGGISPVLGVFPRLALVGLWLRRSWAWHAAFALLRVIFGVVGALITIVTLPASVRRCCGVCILDG